ncbi:hypothetical protein J4G37_21405 [Microvirga sp. 3-52]|nr:hypothetical protein [Microvirga sp. 3-52]
MVRSETNTVLDGRSPVVTGLVPVIPMDRSAAPHRTGMAGTRPAMTTGVVVRLEDGKHWMSRSLSVPTPTSSPGLSR